MKIKDFLNLSLKEIEDLGFERIEFPEVREFHILKKGGLGIQLASDRIIRYETSDGEEEIARIFYSAHGLFSLYRQAFLLRFNDRNSIKELVISLFKPICIPGVDLDKNKSIRYYLMEAKKNMSAYGN